MWNWIPDSILIFVGFFLSKKVKEREDNTIADSFRKLEVFVTCTCTGQFHQGISCYNVKRVVTNSKLRLKFPIPI